MIEVDNWLTGVRVGRLPRVLGACRAHPPPGVPVRQITGVIWGRCGGPRSEVQQLVDVLIGAGLLEQHASVIRLTTRGRQVATQDHQQGGRLLAKALIDGGYFRNQIRKLLAAGALGDDGLICRRSSAIDSAAQLVGILRSWQDVDLDFQLRVPAALVKDLLASWSLQPIPSMQESASRTEIGDRAEAYSFRFEQEKEADASCVQWVALDDGTLGYDIRNGACSPPRCIEVKGSQGSEVRFFLSHNEWTVGEKIGDSYEVHFWGGISRSRPRAEEYRVLREAGYPLVFRNIHKVIASEELEAKPSQYLVRARR